MQHRDAATDGSGTTRVPVAIVGAGPAGIAAALALKDRGIRSLVLDSAETVASSWRVRYDRLRLNTCRPFSHLPDRPFPKGTPMFPTRDQLIAHVERHAAEAGFDLRLGTEVSEIQRENYRWALETASGRVEAPQLVVATGLQHVPDMPAWPGRDDFEGELLHAAGYRSPEPFRGRSVLVVGTGSSGMEIAHDLADRGAAEVRMSVRTPPNIVLREGPVPGDMIASALLHLPTRLADRITRLARKADVGDLTEFGLPVPDEGVFARLRRERKVPAILDEDVIEAIKDGRVRVVPDVDSLDPAGVRFADGSRIEPDAVICATGYRTGLERLVGHLGVLDSDGVPLKVGPEAAAPGLRFIGYVPRPGGLGYMGKEAKRAAKRIRRELRSESNR